MDLTFLYSPGFVAEWERQRLTDDDLVALEGWLAEVRASAPVMRGTGGLRKTRFAPPSRHIGKRGAMRVGFAFFQSKSAIIVVAMFSKSEMPNFTAAQRVEIGKWLKRIERSFR
jgi:hypothetical protein